MDPNFLLDDVDLSDHDFLALAGGVHTEDALLFASPQSPIMRTEDMVHNSNGSILPLYISSTSCNANIVMGLSKRKLDNDRILSSSIDDNEVSTAAQLHKRRAQYCDSPEYSTSSEFSESSGSDISSLANDCNEVSSLDGLSKRESRLLRNRMSAIKCRQKKKQEISEMASKVTELMQEINALKQENAGLRAHNTALMDHNRFLRDLLAQSKVETLPLNIHDVESSSHVNKPNSSAGVCTLGVVGVFVALKRIFGASAATVSGRIVSSHVLGTPESSSAAISPYWFEDTLILSPPLLNAFRGLIALAVIVLGGMLIFELWGRLRKK